MLEELCGVEFVFELDEPVPVLELLFELEVDFFGASLVCFGFGAGAGVVCAAGGVFVATFVGVLLKNIAQIRVPKPATTSITSPRRTKEILRGISWSLGGIRK